jgi:hypothetical protein
VSLTIGERILEDGSRETVTLEHADGALLLRVGGSPARLPEGALERVMTRYGKPLAEAIVLDGPALDVGEGRVLRLFRHRARYDVIARDFLVWSAPGQEPLAELAIAVTAALVHLAGAAMPSDDTRA